MKKIILISVSLFLFCSLAFANSSSELDGQWKVVSYICRVANGDFTIISEESELQVAFNFDKDNKFETQTSLSGCMFVGNGIYVVDGNSLTLLFKFHDIHQMRSGVHCVMAPLPEGDLIVYDEFILKDHSLYLKDDRINHLLSHKCANGTVFQKFVKEVI